MNLVNCPNCKKRVRHNQVVNFRWEKTKKTIIACPYCFRSAFKKHIKDLDFTPQTLAIIKTMGFNSLDIKSDLEQWNKNLFETF